MNTKPKRYSLCPPSTGCCSTYHFYGGVYALGWPLFSEGGFVRRLDLYQLPSANKGIEYKRWSHPDVGVDIYDFAIEPDFDLLVLLELGESLPIIGAIQGSPNVTQHFHIHLRSLKSCAPHPEAAAASIISHGILSVGRVGWSFTFRIVGRYLAISFLNEADQSDKNNIPRLKVWDWMTGNVAMVSSGWTALQED